MALGRGNQEKAVSLFRRAVSLHEKALRISKLEGMLDEFPWAENGLSYTIAHCHEYANEALPYDLKTAYENSIRLEDRINTSLAWQAKSHLVEHVKGFIAFKMGSSDLAEKHFRKSLEGLNQRKIGNQIDKKGLADQKAEVLFHIGLIYWSRNTDTDRGRAKVQWKKARSTIEKAWESEAVRAWNEQYWSFHQLKTSDKETKRLRDFLQKP